MPSISFLPFLRRGLAASVARTDGPPSTPAVPETTFAVTVTTNAGDAHVDVPLVGPGDIVGLDTRVIVRTTPGSNETDAEFKHLVALELDQADLPWRYTPAAADGQRLRPWLTLIVLEDGEWTAVTPTASQRLPTASISKVAALPKLDLAWSWAHVQLHGAAVSGTPAAIASAVTGAPGQFVARLLSPRVLRKQTRYTALLVPTYKRGVLAGLGTPDTTGAVDALALAWLPGDPGPITLPIYHQWSFQTGIVGDFRDLAAKLVPQPLPATVGRRNMDVSQPGFEMPSAAVTGTALPMVGALQSIQSAALPEPAISSDWTAKLTDFINTQQKALDNKPKRPVIAPPLYGRWYAAQTTLNSSRPWFYQVNDDPRYRASAGLGTKVVVDRHQELMASAWSQIEALLDANGQLKVLQLGRETFKRALFRHLLPKTGSASDTFLLSTHVMQRKVLNGTTGNTIYATLGSSIVGQDILEPAWRRIARPRGFVGRRQNRHLASAPRLKPITVMAGGFQPAPPPPPKLDGMTTPDQIYDPSAPGHLNPPRLGTLTGQGNDVLLFWGLALFCVSRKFLTSPTVGRSYWWILRVLRFALELIRIANGSLSTTFRMALRDGTLTGIQLRGGPRIPVFTASPDALPNPIGPAPASGSGNDSPDAAMVREQAAQMLDLILGGALPALPRIQIDLPTTTTRLSTGIDPSTTLPAGIAFRFKLFGITPPADPLEPVLAAPEFPQPMWSPLSDLSTDWILPGMAQVQTNSVGLLAANQKFIEAYMVGLNHEMARTLLWNGYPTDQRGTYFRQFWDSRGFPATPSTDLRDIQILPTWAPGSALGTHSSRTKVPGLALLVRGDLIHRYPNVVVYAVPIPTGPPVSPTGAESHPLFAGRLGQDTAFYGFSLTQADIATSPGWFFVVQEQPAEPRFDPADALAAQAEQQPTFVYPADVQATTAADFAVNTYQHPVRVAIPATLLLPSS